MLVGDTGSSASAAASRSVRLRVIGAAAVTALGGLLFGYDTGVVSGALLFLKNQFGGLSSFQQELVTSLLLIGAMIGAFGAGRVADRIGRRPTVLITAVIFVVGVLLAALHRCRALQPAPFGSARRRPSLVPPHPLEDPRE
jgi:MFS family permease